MAKNQKIEKQVEKLKNLETYNLDKRMPIAELYKALLGFKKKYDWKIGTIFEQELTFKNNEGGILPIPFLTTPLKGRALWILSGIHGEEPAGPNALARNINIFGKLGKRNVPIVLLPLCNPLGYLKNWRYPNAAEYSPDNPGASVGDSEHLLINNSGQPRRPHPACPEARALTNMVLKLAVDYPPLLVLDFHEDDKLDKGYIYSQGIFGQNDPLAKEVVNLFLKNNCPIQNQGKTRFNEKIENGVATGANDGSIDELLSSEKIIVNGSVENGPKAQSVIVVETCAKKMPLKQRIKIYSAIMSQVEKLWQMAEKERT